MRIFVKVKKDIIEKAKDYSKLIKIKKMGRDGVERTYWVSPEDMNEGKNKGQQNLFETEDQQMSGEGYHEMLDNNIFEHHIKPLIQKFGEIDQELGERIKNKYDRYIWDRDTKEEEIKLDYETIRYMQKKKNDPDNAEEYEKEFHEKTDRQAKILNNRKMKMLKMRLGFIVSISGNQGRISGFSRRGYPIIDINGKKKKVFYEEILTS